MKRLLCFLSILMILAFALPSVTSAQEAEQFNMPKKDGRQGDKTVTGRLQFYDMGGPTGKTPDYYAGYTRFVPANGSNQIQITFEEFDLSGAAALYIYDGDIDFTGYYSTVPEGYLTKLSGNEAGQSYVSTTGSLSVLYHCKGSGEGAGWSASVEEYSPKPQEWKQATATQEGLSLWRGRKDAPLLCVDLTTDGGLNPLAATSLTFSLEGTTTLSDLSNLRVLYSGGNKTPRGEAFGQAVTAAGSTLTYTGEVALHSGHNYFWLVADVNANPQGTAVDASLTSATVAGQERVSTPLAPAGTLFVTNEAHLAADPLVYQIGSTPLNLYDDGGKEAGITQNFEGGATFVPTTPGSKLRVRFKALDLFNTSSIGLNDVLSVYAGREATDDALLATVLNDLVTVSSTAADGSLTIHLASKAATPKGGFEAQIEEFVPQPMSVGEVVVTHPDLTAVSAGSSDASILLINFRAIDTEPALTLSSFSFASTSEAPLTKAALYFLGKSADGASTLVGETAAPGAGFDITGSATLSEGNNYFLLRLDIGDRAENGQSIDCSLTKAVTSAGSQIAVSAGNPEGNRVIENVYYSTTGTFSKTIYGSWKYANTPSAYSYYGYDDTQGSQTVTFRPGNTGKIIELEFSKFKISKSSYVQSTFVVYDGADISAPVLWEMNTSNAQKGPERTLRATNPDGVLTVTFNSGGSRGSSGYGFEAAVSEYESVPMTVESAKAVQQSAGAAVKPAQADLPVLGIAVTTKGDKNPLAFNSLSVNLKECAQIVKKVKLYATDRSGEFTTDRLLTEADAAASVTLAPTTAYTMPEKESWLWVAFDMADSFASDIAVDASVTELKIGGTTVAMTDPDPEGNALTKNIYYFEGGEKKMTVDGSLLFYDDGGPDGKYTNTTSGTLTFLPAREGEIIRMTVKSFWTNYQDYLYFYDGDSTSGAELLSLSSSKKAEEIKPVISKADNGAITVAFNPKKNNINDGWEILVESYKPRELFVSGVEVTPVNDVKMLRGSSDNKLLKLAVKVEGDKGKLDIQNFTFSALDSDAEAVTAAKVWYTGEVDTFDNNTLYGEALTEAPYSFSGSMVHDVAATYYYWLTYDISAQAENDAKVQARFMSLTAAGVQTAPAEEKKVLVTVQPGVHGSFSVGTSGEKDFRTITEAVNSLTGGIDGPVIFELEDGNYNELVTIPEVTGTSPQNTITIRSASGNRDNVTINYDTYRDPGSSAYDKRYGVVTFDGVDYCTLQNVTVTSGAVSPVFPGVVFLRGKSEHITLSNCVVRLPKSIDLAKGSYLVYQYAKNEANQNNNFLTVENCLLEGGYIGVGLTGTSFVALPKQRGGIIRGCEFRNQGGKAIYLNCEEDATITCNTIYADGELTSSYCAMDISDAGGNMDISANSIRIKDLEGTRVPVPTGLYIRGYNVDKIKAGTRRIYNNEVNMTGLPGNGSTMLRVNTDYPGLEIVNNTLLGRASVTDGERLYGIYLAGGIPGGRIVNNIVQNDTPGEVLHAARRPYLDNVTLSNNVMYTAGENFAYIGADPNGSDPESFVAGAKTFEDFCRDASMTASYCEQTEFLSENVLEPADCGSLLNGLPVEYVTEDLYGAKRAQTPTIGAYEYAESDVAPAMPEDYPQITGIQHDRAELRVASSLTGTLHYTVLEAEAQAPDAEAVKNEDLTVELRKGVAASVPLTDLSPKTSYRVYMVLTSLRGFDSKVIAANEFTTTYEPTRVADFENATVTDGRLLDGTMSFTGFSVTDIEDGVLPHPNAKAAVIDDEYAVVQLLNAENLPIEGFFMRNTKDVTLTTKDDKLATVKSKVMATADSWRYVDLRDMGEFTYLEFESEGDVTIDNFAALPLSMIVTIDFDEDTAVKAGDAVTVSSAVDGGVPPYLYSWTNAAGTETGTEAAMRLDAEVSNTYTLTVTDARGAKASASAKMRVLSPMRVASFDDLYLAPESQWYGNVDDEDYMSGSFFSGSFEFNNLYMADWDSWAFFGYSNRTSTSFSSYTTDQWNSAVGHGVEDSANYGVVYVSPYMGKTVTTLSNTEEGQTVPGVYITNSAWVVDAIENGDGMEGKFEQDDLLTLQVTGLKADDTSTTLEFPLADYRDSEASEHWYLDTWQWIDLSELGDVKSLEWNILSTKKNSAGITTPTYVCIDNLGASRPVTETATVNVAVNEEEPTAKFSLAPYFSFGDTDGRVEYTLLTADDGLSLEGDCVSITAKSGSELSLTAQAAQRGRREWVRIPVKVDAKPLGIDTATIGNVAIFPNPADTYTNVNVDATGYSLQIVAMDGTLMHAADSLNGRYTLDTSALPAGIYILKFRTDTGVEATRKLIVRH